MSEIRFTSHRWLVGALALGLAALACSAPSASGQATPSATVLATRENAEEGTIAPTAAPPTATQASGPDVIPQGPTATTGASPTPPPSPTTGGPTATPLTGGGDALYEDISFFFPYSISSKWEVKLAPSDPAGDGPEAWRVATHYEFSFPGYPVAGPKVPHAATILIFPVAAWQNYNTEAVSRIAALQKLLKDKPTTFGQNESIPLLPVFNAAQVFRGHVAYLDFKNGSGVRFITQYDQAPIPLNNQELFYTFQGVTSDGKYNVAAFFPIAHPSLPADDSNAAAVVGSDFLAYLAATTQGLEAQKENSFTPDLGALDLMMQSLKVK